VTELHQYSPWISGSFLPGEGRELLVLKEPATGNDLAKLFVANQIDVNEAVLRARQSLLGPWGRTTPTERGRILHRAADLLDARRIEFAELEARNVGKAISSVNGEIGGAIETLRFYASVVGAQTGSSATLGGSLLTYSLREPVGVCVQIVPWNYPLLMTMWKLAPALAAGCAIVLKPDLKTPISALLLAETLYEAGVPEGVLNVLPGGADLGAMLVGHKDVDKVAFTGSTATGSEVMRLASSPIKRLTLELGGKSPNIIFGDADLGDAIPSACWSIFYAAGQSCEARSRILVEESIFEEFVVELVKSAEKIVTGDPLDPKTQVGSLISEEHRQRVHSFVLNAKAAGAQILLGGVIPIGEGFFYPPTIITNVKKGDDIEQEEVFGPVVIVQTFKNEEEAIEMANSTDYGLFASVWTRDGSRAHRLARRIQSGMIGLNTPYTAFPGVSFGGYKQSGFGRELSIETLDAYTEIKSVIFSTGLRPANPFKL
jgi:acyl-CoA reductase-like NAD-dependent aldehyde dehydrogenase